MKFYLYIIVSFLLLIGCSDWDENFDSKKTKPFGTAVLQKEMATFFPDKKMIVIKHNFIKDVIDNLDFEPSGNYVAIDGQFRMNTQTTSELLSFIEEGNIAFIATRRLNTDLEEALGINFYKKNTFLGLQKNDDYTLSFTSNNLDSIYYNYKRYLSEVSIDYYNDNTTSVLGYSTNKDGDSEPNFIRVAYGDGAFYIHTQPLVFTNFYLLNNPEHSKYVANCFSYLREDAIFWDNYNISNRSRSMTFENPESNNQPETFSELDYFLENDSLRMALIISLLGFGLFLLFKTKRKQRIIPIIPPLRNASIDFTKTISNLYLNNKSNEDIAYKKLTYFYEKLRIDLRMNTKKIDNTFLLNLHQKTGIDKKELNQLLITIRKINDQIKGQLVHDEDLLKLDRELHQFYTKTKIL